MKAYKICAAILLAAAQAVVTGAVAAASAGPMLMQDQILSGKLLDPVKGAFLQEWREHPFFIKENPMKGKVLNLWPAHFETEAAEETESETEPPVYEATASAAWKGYEDGRIEVSVTLNSDGEILDVEILDCSSQYAPVGQVAAPVIAERIEKEQTTYVDAISGATQTSEAVKKAAAIAIHKAKEELK